MILITIGLILLALFDAALLWWTFTWVKYHQILINSHQVELGMIKDRLKVLEENK